MQESLEWHQKQELFQESLTWRNLVEEVIARHKTEMDGLRSKVLKTQSERLSLEMFQTLRAVKRALEDYVAGTHTLRKRNGKTEILLTIEWWNLENTVAECERALDLGQQTKR